MGLSFGSIVVLCGLLVACAGTGGSADDSAADETPINGASDGSAASGATGGTGDAAPDAASGRAPGEAPPHTGPAAGAGGTGRGEFAHLAVSPSRTTVGGEVTLTLRNRSEQPIGYNLCPVTLERQVSGRWEERPERPAEVCTMELRVLLAGGSDTYRHTIPPGVPAGTYRFRLRVEWPMGEDNVSMTSDSFEVQS
jgi:hypothetical protein